MTDDTAARLQITETLNRYAWSYDTRDLDLMAECFTADGVFDITLEGTDGWGPYRGRQTIVDWLASIMATQNDQRRHCLTNLVFRELGADSARVDSYLVLTAVEAGALRVVCTGTYHDTLVVDDGAWRIAYKTLKLDNDF